MKNAGKLLRRMVLEMVVLLVLPLALGAYWVMQPVWTVGEPSPERVDPERLKAHVTRLAVDFSPRSYLDASNLVRCAEYIRAEFERSGAVVTSQYYQAMGRRFENVIARFPGERAERLVVGAHYDAQDVTPGADDNASGVAGLIELAQLLSETPWVHTVELVAYCTEEPPFFDTPGMGSLHHARALRDAGIDVRAMLALEMIGYFSDEEGIQTYPATFFRLLYPSRGDFIGVIGNLRHRGLVRDVKASMRGATPLSVWSMAGPSWVPGVDFSDHRSYWACGFPAVMITDTAFYRNRTYHQPGDTPDRLDYARLACVVAGVHRALQELDR